MTGRLVAFLAWGAAAGLYLYVMATARQRADARRHQCRLLTDRQVEVWAEEVMAADTDTIIREATR